MTSKVGISTWLLTLSVVSLYFVQSEVGAVTPALASISASFPGVPMTTIALIATLANFVATIFMLITGRIAGTVFRFKPLLLIGLILFFAGGVAPYFFHSSITVILVFRCIFGVGLGIVTPLGATMVMAFFEGKQREKVLGLGAAVNNTGGVILQVVGGALAAISWTLCFWTHAVALLPLFFVLFFLPEPEKKAEEEKVTETGEKRKMPVETYVCVICIFFIMILVSPLILRMSYIVEALGMGPTITGFVNSSYTLGGILGGLIFAKVFDKLGMNAFPVICFVIALAMACLSFGSSSVVFCFLAAILAGSGMYNMLPAMYAVIGAKTTSAQQSMASGLIMGFMNLGFFASSYVAAFLENAFHQADNIRFPFYIGLVCFLIAGVVLLFAMRGKKIERHELEE